MGRPLADAHQQQLEVLFGALGNDFHPAIREVLRGAGQSEVAGLMLHVTAHPDALDLPGDKRCETPVKRHGAHASRRPPPHRVYLIVRGATLSLSDRPCALRHRTI